MPPRGLVRAFVAQWWTAGLLLLVWSVQTAQTALPAGRGYTPHVALLGLVEAAAAVLFLIPRTMRLGAAALLLTLEQRTKPLLDKLPDRAVTPFFESDPAAVF